MQTITEAKIYEEQGLKDEALEIYKKILKKDKYNKLAKDSIMRLSGLVSKNDSVNTDMLKLFLELKSENEIIELKRWFINI